MTKIARVLKKQLRRRRLRGRCRPISVKMMAEAAPSCLALVLLLSASVTVINGQNIVISNTPAPTSAAAAAAQTNAVLKTPTATLCTSPFSRQRGMK